MKTTCFALAALILMAPLFTVRADEGFWPFNEPPRRLLKEKHRFDVTDHWLERVQKSAVQLSGGGSGAFVSADGLVLTANHVAATFVQLLPPGKKDLASNGFCAQGRTQELPLPGLSLEVVWEIVDVSDRVRASVKSNMGPRQAKKARDAVMDAIEEESEAKTALPSEVVTLGDGGPYHLYRRKTYNDVRLVFLPDQTTGRSFDACFLRAYEDGKAAHVKHFLRMVASRPQPGELLFVAGFPTTSNRLRTTAHLEALYGPEYYLQLKDMMRTENALDRFARQSPEHARRARDEMASFRTSISKSMSLLRVIETALAVRRAEEKAFRARLADRPALAKALRQAEDRIAAALRERERLYAAQSFLVDGTAFGSSLYPIAQAFVYSADEELRPISARLPPAHAGASWKDYKQAIAADWHVDRELEIVKLTESLATWAERSGKKDDLVARVLAGKSPGQRARELVQGSRLDDATARKAMVESLAQGDAKRLVASADTMVTLARLVAGPARKIDEEYEEKVAEPMEQAYAEIRRIRCQVDGHDHYPDANGTLRLSFGRVRGRGETGTRENPFFSLKEYLPYLKLTGSAVPKGWQEGLRELDPNLLFSFTHSADSAGGNSGSPVLNRQGQCLGVTAWGYNSAAELAYMEDHSLSAAVATTAIVAILDHVYHAQELLKELGNP